MATSFQKFRIWKENVLEELYRKYQGKTIKDDYGKKFQGRSLRVGCKAERKSLIVICGEMVAKLATNDDKKIYSTGIVPII